MFNIYIWLRDVIVNQEHIEKNLGKCVEEKLEKNGLQP